MKKLIVLFMTVCSLQAFSQTSHYEVEVTFKLMDGSIQSAGIKSYQSPTWESVLSDVQNYVKPEKVDKYSLQISVSKVKGTMGIGGGDKFKKRPKQKYDTWGLSDAPLIRIDSVPVMKWDSVVKAPNSIYKQRKSTDYVWINWPTEHMNMTTISFRKSSVIFLNDSTFTYVEKFK